MNAKSSTQLMVASRWMQRTIDNARDDDKATVTVAHVKTWRDVLTKALVEIETRERAIAAAEAQLSVLVGSGVVDAAYAERLSDGATSAVKRLAVLAMDAATKAELMEIDLSACAILDAFEALTHGVVRPAGDVEQQTPDIGA